MDVKVLMYFLVIYSGRLYSEIFEDLPDREEYPDYYSVITDPRSLSMMEVCN